MFGCFLEIKKNVAVKIDKSKIILVIAIIFFVFIIKNLIIDLQKFLKFKILNFLSDINDMRVLSIFSVLVLSLSSCLAPNKAESVSVNNSENVEYSSPIMPESTALSVANLTIENKTPVASNNFMIAGTRKGLLKIFSNGKAEELWTEGSVSKIIKTVELSDVGEEIPRWYFLTTAGIVTTTDLKKFEYRNEGLPFLTIKLYDGKNISFTKQPAQLKDLAIHPENPNILVTSTKECVYLTKNGGKTWTSINSMSKTTNGIKAVAVASMNRPKTGRPEIKNADGTITPAVAPEKDLVVFMAHSICGFSYCYPDSKSKAWNDVNRGFEVVKTYTYPDEIADILPVVFEGSDGFPVTEVFVSQTFLPRLYRFDWNEKTARLLYSGTEPADTIDGLFWNGSKVLYSRPGEIAAYNPVTGKKDFVPPEYDEWKSVFNLIENDNFLNAAWIPTAADSNKGISLDELWLLYPETCNNKYAEVADKRKAIYVQAHKLITDKGIDSYKKVMKDNKLDAIVIDMKDDYGFLHFKPTDPLLLQKAKVSDSYALDLDKFVPKMKEDGIYLIARIVTFKDRSLSKYDKRQYAIWDKTTNAPWKGISGYDENGKPLYYDEDWVDQYSPEVWEYFVHIAQELVARGFDEIQFDYIRFPTDGKNLGNAQYRWKSNGMDKESALLSFLSYARKNIDAPIGIDIYGANGWYRSGTRTGQDVEQLAEYVDVVCPMFYPSHFGQNDSNYAPYTERPYRIYYYGTYRNTVIGRNKLIIRPWIQAFYLNVRYDREYYNKNYVVQQIYGVRDSVDRGYMYWNGRCVYDDISPDVGETPYTGPSYEASSKYKKPALSGGKRIFTDDSVLVNKVKRIEQTDEEKLRISKKEGIARWDYVKSQSEIESEDEHIFPQVSDIRKLITPGT